MSVQERKYMGDDVAASGTKAANEIHDLSGKVEELQAKLVEQQKKTQSITQELESHKRQAERDIKDANEKLRKEVSLREEKEAELESVSKLYVRAKKLIQTQGEALITDHYGHGKFTLLLKARTLLSMSDPAKTCDRYRPPGQTQEQADEIWRRVVCDWFDDFEKEMRGIACEPVDDFKLSAT